MNKTQIATIEDIFDGKPSQLSGAEKNEMFKKSKRNEGKASLKVLFD